MEKSLFKTYSLSLSLYFPNVFEESAGIAKHLRSVGSGGPGIF